MIYSLIYYRIIKYLINKKLYGKYLYILLRLVNLNFHITHINIILKFKKLFKKLNFKIYYY